MADGAYLPLSSRRTATINAPLTINEPVKDSKGKKRAVPEPAPEDDTAGPSTKRPRTSYSLRSSTISSQIHDMPRKATYAHFADESIIVLTCDPIVRNPPGVRALASPSWLALHT